jgi:hypothetical protein
MPGVTLLQGGDMSKPIPTDIFTNELFDLLEETFERVQGIYLDRGTSFFETLETISAQEASRPVSATCASIAAQVEHVRFYLRVLEDCILRKPEVKIDWEESWQLTEVTPEEWEALKQELRQTYQSVLKTMKSLDVWEGEDDIGASLGILAHTAYHLGEIRQALCTIR